MKWTKYENTILKEKYSVQGPNISDLLKRHTKYAISRKACRLGYTNKINKKIKITKKIKEIIDGMLLGDGGYVCNRISSYIRICQTETKKDFLTYIKELLDAEGVKTSNIRLQNHAGKFTYGGYDSYRKPSYTFWTGSYGEFLDERKKWGYTKTSKGKNIIPDDVSIEPLSLALWYMGDGHRKHRPKHNLYELGLSTECFTKQSLDRFIKRINKKYGIKMTLESTKEAKQYKTKISSKKSIFDFLTLTIPYMVDCFAYKWDPLFDEKFLEKKPWTSKLRQATLK